MSDFFNSASSKSTTTFSTESLPTLRKGCADSHESKRLKQNLQTIKELYSFIEEVGSTKRAKVKMSPIEPIGDQLESHCDDKQNLLTVT